MAWYDEHVSTYECAGMSSEVASKGSLLYGTMLVYSPNLPIYSAKTPTSLFIFLTTPVKITINYPAVAEPPHAHSQFNIGCC